MRPFPAEPLRMWPISTRVNEDPTIVGPIKLATDPLKLTGETTADGPSVAGRIGEMVNGPQIDHRNPVNGSERTWPHVTKNIDSI